MEEAWSSPLSVQTGKRNCVGQDAGGDGGGERGYKEN
jgi:hypothetical protein